jgi:hypothetical protein
MAYKKILLRRDTASNWTSANPTLSGGEMGVETDTLKFKLGNGSTAWNSLNYYVSPTLNDIGDVTITSAADGDFLRWNGTAWINDAVNLSTDTVGSYVESLVAGTGITLTNNSGEAATPTVTVDTTVIAPLANPTFTGAVVLPDNTVALGTKTTGDYVESLVAGTGITLTYNYGEGATPTIAIGQAVETNSDVTFNSVIVAGNLTVSGATTSIATETLTIDDNIIVLNNNATGAPVVNAGIEIERGSSANVQLRWNETQDTWEITTDGSNYGTIATTADVSASSGAITVDNLSDVVITSAANKDFLMYNGTNWVDQAITLGTDTTGDYVATITGGTGVTSTATTTGEGTTHTLSIGQAVETSSSVTFANVTADLVGNVTGNVTGSVNGNTGSATVLQTARNIAGQSFNGSADISIAPTDLTGVTATASEINTLDGITASTAELNVLDGITASVAELNILDGVTSSAAELNILDGVTSSAAELNILDGATLSTVELNYVDGVTSAIQTQIDAKAPSADPTFTGVVTLPDNTVALGTKTTGDYVASLVAGTGVTLTNNSGETATPTVAIGQAVGTSASVTFADITVTGILALAGDPASALHAATKEYVDNVASGVVAKPSVLGATTTNIDATYANGTLGVGGTLTANSNGVFPSDFGGASGWAVGKGILVKNQTNKEENGRYFVSDMGSVSTPYVLTRCSYCDEASEIPGAYIFVQDGTLAGTGWIQVVADPATFVVGTDDIDVFQFSGAGTLLGGNGLVLTDNTFNVGTADVSRIVVNADNIDLATTGITAGTYNSVSVDVYGRVTSASVASYVDTSDTGTVTSTMIADGTIVNADINASAAIAHSKLANATAGQLLLGTTTTGVVTATTVTGDVTITGAGVTAIATGVVVNADISSTAAIELGKLADVSTSAQTASYTLVLADKNKIVEMSVGSANNLTVPPNSSVAFPVGSQINILQTNTGQTTIVAGAGVTINATPGLKIRAQWSYATLVKRAENTWVLVGDISA